MLPLVVGTDGRRLAKRHGDTRLATYRVAGVGVGRILSLLARWCGMEIKDYASADEMVGKFDLARLPRAQIVMTAADELLIRQGAATLR